jgi:NAD+ synthase (glutamine-hydrolysing)
MVRRASNEIGWEEFFTKTGISSVPALSEAVHTLLTCAYQGTKNSSQHTWQAAQSLASSIGATFHTWKIDDQVNAYTTEIEKALGRSLTWQTDDIALQNIQARSRSPIIWLLANIKRSVLLTTSNRSEGDVGYATMDGDTSGSLAPIAGIDKPFIIQWLKWAEKELGYSGLAYVNNLQPTAELRPLDNPQTDEKDLMPYLVLVAIEKLAIRDRKPPIEVFHQLMKLNVSNPLFTDKQVLKNQIKKFFRLWAANQWKRERLAPSFHLDELNVDPRSWCRFPILSGSFEQELAELDSQ